MNYFRSIEEIPNGVWVWPNFSPKEWACKETGEIAFEPEFMDKLQELRNRLRKPLVVTSGYRSPEHSAEKNKENGPGPHSLARAVDLSVRGGLVFQILSFIPELGFTGIGLKQHGSDRFLHLDDLTETPFRPRPWVWTYS